MIWEKTNIRRHNNDIVEGIAPVIVSASRSTDIPAFYSEWMINRLRYGYSAWINPHNGKTQYISFQKTRFIVFWSKNPALLLDVLPEIDKMGFGYYVQFTLNNYDNESYEPNVPPVDKRIDTFKRLADLIGPHRVIWRFDPLILTDRMSVALLLLRIKGLMVALHKYTEKMVFSFADINNYKMVRQNLNRADVSAREFNPDEMFQVSQKIAELCKEYGLKPATCAETIDLSQYGIEHNRCIDDDLIARCCPEDEKLLAFLGRDNKNTQEDLFDAAHAAIPSPSRNLKDKGQRKACGCIASKDVGSYNTCPHSCLYCYANTSPKSAREHWQTYTSNSESI